MDFGRSMAYLGRAGWDNENTLLIQGERHLTLLTDLELIDADHRLTADRRAAPAASSRCPCTCRSPTSPRS